MKTDFVSKSNSRSIKKSMPFCILLLCMFSFVRLTGQIASPYPVTNNTGCNVNISYVIYDNTCSNIGSGSQTIPSTGANITVPMGGVDIEMTVNWINAATCVVTQQPNNPVITSFGSCTGLSASALTDNGDVSCGGCTVININLFGSSALIQ